MAKRTSIGLILALLLLMAGCAHNAFTGKGGRHEQVLHGTVGISGSEHELTILPGSDVSKLSIIGEDNEVVIADGAIVTKVEIIGEDNEVECPAGMPVEYSEIGEDNRLIHRQER